MTPLPEQFTYDGFTFTQERRSARAAIYRQQWNGKPDASIAYEVVVPQIRRKRYGKNGWEDCEPYEGYPSSEQWGTAGWTYTDLDRAVEKFLSLSQRQMPIAA
jgi:hypothetical protein